MGNLIAEYADESAMKDAEGFMEQMAHFHPEDANCWYLPIIGVDCAHQGQGIGAALMKHALQLIDGVGGSAYLESSNPRNVSLYQRHGFEAMGVIQHGSSPTSPSYISSPCVPDWYAEHATTYGMGRRIHHHM